MARPGSSRFTLTTPPRGFGGENDGNDTNHTASENESLQIVLADSRLSAPDSMVGFYIL